MSVEGEDLEGEGEVGERKKMAGAVETIRNFGQRLQAKRRLECPTENDVEYPNSKRMMTEEDMAYYLEQLQLAAKEASQQTLADGLLSLRHTVTEGRASSSGHLHKNSLSPRKRTLDLEAEEGMECYDDSCSVSESANAGERSVSVDGVQWKRSRLDGITSPPPAASDEDRTKQLHYNFDSSSSLWHSTAEVPVFHNTGDFRFHLSSTASPVLVPPCSRTSLSSIPEVLPDTRERKEAVACGFKVEEAEEEEEQEEEVGKENPLEGGRVWIAPEVQDLCASQKPLLPVSIVEEIKTRGMELVPYVGPRQILHSLSDKDAESSTGETLEDKEENSSTMDS